MCNVTGQFLDRIHPFFRTRGSIFGVKISTDLFPPNNSGHCSMLAPATSPRPWLGPSRPTCLAARQTRPVRLAPSVARRSYGRADLVSLSVASTVGSGVFSLAGRVASQEAGPAVVLSLGIGALGCVLSATAYAELSSRVVAAGPEPTFLFFFTYFYLLCIYLLLCTFLLHKEQDEQALICCLGGLHVEPN